ncbi:MAG TPA: DUF3426 domain-containing protein [Steroidobacteraceae bacterium]
MYSQCPECLTRFRVTAAVLRAAHGTVRCGRCGSAFDALQRLTDAVPDEAEPTSAPARLLMEPSLAAFDGPGVTDAVDRPEDGHARREHRGSEPSVVTEFHFSADDIEQVFVDARDWQKRYPPVAGDGSERTRPARRAHDASAAVAASANDDKHGHDDVEDPASSHPPSGAPVMLVHEPEAIEDITLEGERIVIEGLPEFDDDLREIVREGETADDAVPLADGEPPPADLDATDRFEVLRHASATAHAAPGDGRADPQADAATVRPVIAPAEAAAPNLPFRLRQREFPAGDVFEELGDEDAVAPRRGAAVAWSLGALLLAVVLVAQVAHHYRADLARDVRLGPVVRAAYARLGRPLAPNWDLAAFELRQWGASESVPTIAGTMSVRASLRNGADFAQPLPLLRLELEDRFGGTIARRDFEPREYLKDPAQASRLLTPGDTTEAKLDVVEAGTDAVGYRLDVCMREESGATRCAQSTSLDDSAPR